MTLIDKELLETIEMQISKAELNLKEAKDKKTQWKNKTLFGCSLQDICNSIKKYEEELRNLSGKKEWILAKDYLEKDGVNMDVHPQAKKVTEVAVIKFGDKRFLTYEISYYEQNENSKDEIYIATQEGNVIYNVNGEVLFSENNVCKEKIHFRYSNDGYVDYTNYSYDSYKPKNGRIILETDTDLIIDLMSVGVTSKDAYHFKLKDGKYNLEHAFDDDDYCGIKCSEPFKLLTAVDETKFGTFHGRLYGIAEGKFLTEFNFENLKDTSAERLTRFGHDFNFDEIVRQTMRDENTFLGHTYTLPYHGYMNHVYGLVDTKGNISDNLFYYVHEGDHHNRFFRDDMGYPKVYFEPVTNNSFYETLHRIDKKVSDAIERGTIELIAKREKENAEYEARKIAHLEAKHQDLVESIGHKKGPKKLEFIMGEGQNN